MRNALLAGALAAGALLASPASAATNCVGEQSLAYVCVVTPTVGTGTRTLCLYTGGPTCEPTDVPVPTVEGDVDAYCGGPKYCDLDLELAICRYLDPSPCKV